MELRRFHFYFPHKVGVYLYQKFEIKFSNYNRSNNL